MERLRGSLAVLLCGLLSATSVPATAQTAPIQAPIPAPSRARQPYARQPYQDGQLSGDDRILQALNRFTFGARPGDLEAVRAMGLDKWFAQQLHPEAINNSGLEARLAQFPAMQWSPQDLLFRLPSGAVIRQVADGKIPVPADGALHAVYEDEIARYEARQQKKEEQKQQQVSLTATAAVPVAHRIIHGVPERIAPVIHLVVGQMYIGIPQNRGSHGNFRVLRRMYHGV